MENASELKEFYDSNYSTGRYSHSVNTHIDQHARRKEVESFVSEFGLSDQRCLEVGCGGGAFQDLVKNYTGSDISEVAGKWVKKPFVAASATHLPFADNSFDAIWSVDALEHIPNPALALNEMRRVLRGDGHLLLAPAWHCRPWASKGLPVRGYSELVVADKVVKATIPIRNSKLYRTPGVLAKRLVRFGMLKTRNSPTSFMYKKLNPDYVHNWMSDADAINSIDPFEAILWFVSRGDRCLTYPSMKSAFRVRTGGVAFQIVK